MPDVCTSPSTRGRSLAARRRLAADRLRAVAAGGRPIVRGLTTRGEFLRPLPEVVGEVADLLVASGRLYVRGRDVVMEVEDAGDARLIDLSADRAGVAATSGLLANLFICEVGAGEDRPMQFIPPTPLVKAALSDERLRRRLPIVERHARRPVYDAGFRLLGPGYHPEARTLVHGPAVEPSAGLAATPPAGSPLAEFPLLRRMLRDYPFESPGDFANAVAGVVTAVMPERFTAEGRPVLAVTGNQPNLGKTTYVRQLGVLADGAEPTLVPFTNHEEELRKAVGAVFRDTAGSVLVIDNAKTAGGPISSGVLELYAAAPRIQGRVLGLTATFDYANDRLWCLTANGAKLSPDLTSRATAVRMRYDGDPAARPLPPDDPVQWVRRRRIGLLSEVYGMVGRWVAAGRPEADAVHRYRHWARTIGGILAANGIEGFLDNREEAAAEYDLGREELADLAEAVLAAHGPVGADRALTPKDWAPYFRQAGLFGDRLRSDADNAAATAAGGWLKAHVGRSTVGIDSTGTERRLTLAGRKGGGRKSHYHFAEDDASPAVPAEAPPELADRAVAFPEDSPLSADAAAGGNDLAW